MATDTLPHYDAILGKWKDRGFRLSEVADPIDDTDKLLVLSFKEEIVGSYYKSKIDSTEQAVSIIQKHCQLSWDNRLRQIQKGV